MTKVRRGVLEPLEPRLLMSADLLGAVLVDDLQGQGDDISDYPTDLSSIVGPLQDSSQPEAGIHRDNTFGPLLLISLNDRYEVSGDGALLTHVATPSIPLRQEIVFIDGAAPDPQGVIDRLWVADTRELIVFVIEPERDGLQQIVTSLRGFSDVDAIHIVSHGTTEGVRLGNAWLDINTLNQRGATVAAWGEALDDAGDLLFYGCELVGGSAGKQLLSALHT